MPALLYNYTKLIEHHSERYNDDTVAAKTSSAEFEAAFFGSLSIDKQLIVERSCLVRKPIYTYMSYKQKFSAMMWPKQVENKTFGGKQVF